MVDIADVELDSVPPVLFVLPLKVPAPPSDPENENVGTLVGMVVKTLPVFQLLFVIIADSQSPRLHDDDETGIEAEDVVWEVQLAVVAVVAAPLSSHGSPLTVAELQLPSLPPLPPHALDDPESLPPPRSHAWALFWGARAASWSVGVVP